MTFWPKKRFNVWFEPNTWCPLSLVHLDRAPTMASAHGEDEVDVPQKKHRRPWMFFLMRKKTGFSEIQNENFRFFVRGFLRKNPRIWTDFLQFFSQPSCRCFFSDSEPMNSGGPGPIEWDGWSGTRNLLQLAGLLKKRRKFWKERKLELGFFGSGI